MALCVPKVTILGYSFARLLSCDLEQHFYDCATSNFNLEDVKVHLFGVGGRMVNKIKPFDLVNVSHFAPDVVISEIGTQIDELVKLSLNHFPVGVVGVCQVIKRAGPTFNKVEVLNLY